MPELRPLRLVEMQLTMGRQASWNQNQRGDTGLNDASDGAGVDSVAANPETGCRLQERGLTDRAAAFQALISALGVSWRRG